MSSLYGLVKAALADYTIIDTASEPPLEGRFVMLYSAPGTIDEGGRARFGVDVQCFATLETALGAEEALSEMVSEVMVLLNGQPRMIVDGCSPSEEAGINPAMPTKVWLTSTISVRS